MTPAEVCLWPQSASSNQRPALRSRDLLCPIRGQCSPVRAGARVGEPLGWGHSTPAAGERLLIFSLHSLAPQTGRVKSKVLSLDVANLALDLSLWLPSGLAPQPLTSSPGHWLGLSHWLLIFYIFSLISYFLTLSLASPSKKCPKSDSSLPSFTPLLRLRTCLV